MELDIYVVDAFTQIQFKGNSAAVIPLDEWIEPSLMQSIAAENNLSETAFIRPLSLNQYEIRWFSPLCEVDFCGHATLAASYVIFHFLGGNGQISFITQQVGTLFVNHLADDKIEMSFPNQSPDIVDEIPDALLAGLSIAPSQVLKNRQAYFAVMNSQDEVTRMECDSELLKTLAPLDVVVTAPGKKYDFVSRYFWPANGGDEDPVTGSIHAGLVPYWSERFNKNQLTAYQASKRGGTLFCRLDGQRVVVSGFAVLYMKGSTYL